MPPGFVLARGELCCLFILVLSSTCDQGHIEQITSCLPGPKTQVPTCPNCSSPFLFSVLLELSRPQAVDG